MTDSHLIAAVAECPGADAGAAFALVDPKSAGTSLTVADHRSREVRVVALRESRPGIPVISEEEGQARAVEPAKLLGVVHARAVGVTCCSINGRAERREHAGPAVHALLARTPERCARSNGSSRTFCLIAEQADDAYPRDGPTIDRLTAAAHAVLSAVGDAVQTIDGRELRYGRPQQRNPDLVALVTRPSTVARPSLVRRGDAKCDVERDAERDAPERATALPLGFSLHLSSPLVRCPDRRISPSSADPR